MGEVGHGILQIVPEFYDTSLMVSRVDMLAELSLEFGIPTTLSPLFESTATPELAGTVLARVQEWSDLGARVWPQVQTRPIDINFTLRERNFMLLAMPSWFEILNLPTTEEKIARYRDPETRARLVSEVAPAGSTFLGNRIADAVVRGVALEHNKPLLGRSLGDIAEERGTTPADAMIDIALEEDLRTEFKNGGLMHTDAEIVGEMLANDYVLIGASDAGAHVQAFATNGDTGYLFSKFVRETGALTMPEAIKKITLDTAHAWGLRDRGVLHPGYGADIVLFDPEQIDRDEEVGVSDLPGNGYRYIRQALGVDTVIVNGEVAYTAEDGYTESTSGELVTLQTPGAGLVPLAASSQELPPRDLRVISSSPLPPLRGGRWQAEGGGRCPHRIAEALPPSLRGTATGGGRSELPRGGSFGYSCWPNSRVVSTTAIEATSPSVTFITVTPLVDRPQRRICGTRVRRILPCAEIITSSSSPRTMHMPTTSRVSSVILWPIMPLPARPLRVYSSTGVRLPKPPAVTVRTSSRPRARSAGRPMSRPRGRRCRARHRCSARPHAARRP